MATEDKRIDQLDPVSVLDLTSLMAMQQGANSKKVTLQQLLDYLNGQIDTGNAVLFVSQTLTDAQKLQARTNIGAAAPGEGGGSAEGAVLYTEQTLTEEQQHQARLNIRCGSVGEVADNCVASGSYAHAEGLNTKATGIMTHAEGENCVAKGGSSHVEGVGCNANGEVSHAEGYHTVAKSAFQHVQGMWNIPEGIFEDMQGKYAHIVGNGTSETKRSNAHTLDWKGLGWFAGGLKVGGTSQNDTAAQDILPSAVQYVEQTLTPEQQHHARLNIRCGSVGEVSDESVASGEYSHAEGFNTRAAGYCAHAEGFNTEATNYYAHSEGRASEAAGEASHAEGDFTRASGRCSHTEGDRTVANGEAQHVQGRRNIEDNDNRYAHIVGNGGYGIVEGPDGEQIPFENYSNAHTLDWAGVPWFAGDRVMLGGIGMDDEAAVALMPVFVPQELTEEQKLQARTNIGAAAIDDIPSDVVTYTEQALTEEQKAKARANIGVDAYIEQVFLGGEW